MRFLAAILSACLIAGPAKADPPQPQQPPQPPPRMRLLGVADAEGRIVVEPIYPALRFSDLGDWAMVSSRDGSGFVNLRTGARTGLIFDAVPSDFYSKTPLFADGPEPVVQNGKGGYADETGRMVLPAIYEAVGRFGPEGLALVTLEGRKGFIDRAGHFTAAGDYDQIWDFRAGLARVRKGDKFGAIDREGKLVIPLRFGFLGDFTAVGLAPASEDGWLMREGAHYGFVDRSGRFVIAPVYAAAYGFTGPEEIDRQAPPGLARVAIYEADGSQRTGYIDSKGHMVALLPPGLYGSEVSPNGLIKVQDGKSAKWGFADASGRVVIPATFDSVGDFGRNGLAPARDGSGKYGYIRGDGSFAIEPIYDGAGTFDAQGRAQVWQGKESRLIDSSGKVLASYPATVKAMPLAPSGFAPIEFFPPRYDYPVRRFGRWTLERTLEAVPEIPSLGPSPDARIRLSMRSEDGLIAWTAETEGWTLTLKTETNPGDPDRTDYSETDVLPFGAIGLLDYFRRHMRGEYASAISSSSANIKAQAEQAARLRTIAARRGDYLRQLDESRPDLERAWTAMQEDIAAQFGKLSGRPCGVTECVY